MRSSSAKIASLLGVVVLLIAGCKSARSSSDTTAPEFELKDLDGQPVKLSDLRGHPVLLDFWATWCGPCQMSTPLLEEFYDRHKDEGLRVIGMNMDDEPSGVYGFVKHFKMSYPIVLAATSSVANDFGVQGLPTFVMIDAQGQVVQRFEGFSEQVPGLWESKLQSLKKS